MEKTTLLNQTDIKNLITMKEVVEICDKTFQDYGKGKTINPAKVLLDLGEQAEYPAYEGFMNAMPAYIGWLDIAGIKWAGGFLGKRRELGFPYITSLILLIDPKVGNFVAAMDGAYITNLRTGAQSAVALKYIKQDIKSITLGLYGAGMQGRTQTMAISELFDIEELIVYDINIEASKNFAEEMKGFVKGEIKVASTPEEAASADTIVCVTQSKEPFLKDKWIKPGTVVFPMGSYQECEDSLLLNSDYIIVDHVEQCLHRGVLSGLCERNEINEESIFATIGELSVHAKQVVSPESKRIVCIPIGTGAMDVAVAKCVLDKANTENIGGSFNFVEIPNYQPS